MDFLIAHTFLGSLYRLQPREQKQTTKTVFELQANPQHPGLRLHKIKNPRDPNFSSITVNRDIRIIVHRCPTSFFLVYVDHHEPAYQWAERRRIEEKDRAEGIRIVTVEEVTEISPRKSSPEVQNEPRIFAELSAKDLIDLGVPENFLEPVSQASEAKFFELYGVLPPGTAEALLAYATSRPSQDEALDHFPYLDENLDAREIPRPAEAPSRSAAQRGPISAPRASYSSRAMLSVERRTLPSANALRAAPYQEFSQPSLSSLHTRALRVHHIQSADDLFYLFQGD